jgi:hypothetical protein
VVKLSQHQDDPLVEALGGKRGVADLGLPGLVFVSFFTATKNLTVSVWAAVGVAALLTVIRLIRRETLQHAINGFIGVAICAFFALKSGKAENYFLPGLLVNAAYAGACIISILVRWPLLGLALGPLLKEDFAWRRVPERLAVYTKITWVWAALFLFRLLVKLPLYLTSHVTALGIVHALLGWPLWAVGIYLTWRILRKAPPPVKAEDLKQRDEQTEHLGGETAPPVSQSAAGEPPIRS